MAISQSAREMLCKNNSTSSLFMVSQQRHRREKHTTATTATTLSTSRHNLMMMSKSSSSSTLLMEYSRKIGSSTRINGNGSMRRLMLVRSRGNSSIRRLLQEATAGGFGDCSSSMFIDQIDQVLRYTIARYSNDTDVTVAASNAYDEFISLFTKHNTNNRFNRAGSSNKRLLISSTLVESLSNISMILSMFLSSTDAACPAHVIYDIHTLHGLVEQEQGRYSEAIQSYLKALWIASSSSAVETILPRVQVACTLHRLGKAYGSVGEYYRGAQVLANALEIYEQQKSASPTRKDYRVCIVDARHAYQDLSHEVSRSQHEQKSVVMI